MQPEAIDSNTGPANSPKSNTAGELKLERAKLKDVQKSEISEVHPDETPPLSQLVDIKISSLPISYEKKLSADIEDLKVDASLIIGEEIAAETLARLKPSTMREMVKTDHVVDSMVNHMHSRKNFHEVMMVPLESLLKDTADTLKERFAEGIEFGDPILNIPERMQIYSDMIVNDILRAQLAVTVPTQILLGGLLISRSNIIDAAERLLEKINNGDIPNYDPEKRKKLIEVIFEQKSLLKDQIRDFTVNTCSYFPQAVQVFLRTQSVSNVTPLMTAFGAATALGWVATSAYDLWKAVRGAKFHSEFTASQKEKAYDIPRKPPIDPNMEPIEPIANATPIDLLLQKREKAQIGSRNSLRDSFFTFLDSCKGIVDKMNTQSQNFNYVRNQLLRYGASNLSFAYRFNDYVKQFPQPNDPKELDSWLNDHLSRFKKKVHQQGENEEMKIEPKHFYEVWNSPAFRFSLLDQHAEHKQTLTVETKAAVKSLALKKLSSERKFFNFRVGSAAALFTLSSLAAAGTIALKVLACVGIIAATSLAISIPGLGLFVGGTILLGAGLFFLYKYKPNLFKGLLKGTAIALTFNKIPMAYYNYQLHKAKSLRDEKAAYVGFLSARISEIEQLQLAQEIQPGTLSKEMVNLLNTLKSKASQEELSLQKRKEELDRAKIHLQEELERYEIKKQAVDAKIAEIEATLNGYKTKIESLKLELSDRGTQDFLRAANYNSPTEKNRVIDVSTRIAENIAAGNVDEETKEIFKSKLGIDLEEHRYDKEQVKNAMKHYFGLDQQDMEKLIRKLKIREEAAAAAAA